MNTTTNDNKLPEVPVTPYEGTELGTALQNYNAALRQWNAIDEAPKLPGPVITIFKVWVGWALFLAASSLAVIVLAAVIR